MSTATWTLRRVHSLSDAQIDQLADVVMDCVNASASIGFMQPFTRDRALAFWQRIARAVEAGERAIIIAEDSRGICGTVQLILNMPDNQPHRADLVKMMVHRRARKQGLGEALMRAAETMARDCDRTLLVLDAVTGGDAARLYERLGWTKVGDIPRFALFPDGRECGTTYYYKEMEK